MSVTYPTPFLLLLLLLLLTPLPPRTVLLAFINCLVISTPQLKDRNRLRNEFIGEYTQGQIVSTAWGRLVFERWVSQ